MKLKTKSILKYVTLAFVFCVLSCAKVGELSPFLYALFFACIYVGLDEKILALLLVGAGLVGDLSLSGLFCSLTVCAVGLITFYIHKFSKKKMKFWSIFLAYPISLVTYVYYSLPNIWHLIWYASLGFVCLYVFVVVLQTILIKKNCFKLTLDEAICFLFVISLLGMGINSVVIWKFELYRFVLAFMIFILASIGCAGLSYPVVLAFSLGVSLSSMSITPLGEFVVLAMVVSIFSMPHKFKMVSIAVLADVFVQYFFFNQSWILVYSVLPVFVMGLVFCVLKNSWIQNLADLVYVKSSEISSRSLINITRKSIKRRMAELSNVFHDMKQIHLNMVKKDLSKEELVGMLSRELGSTICRDCLDKNRCNRALGTDNVSSIETLFNTVIDKGKVTLLDIPSSLTNRCAKVNQVVSQINRLGDEYRQFRAMQTDVNNVKLLLADQMGAVSSLLMNLGSEIDENVRFDIAKENKIISRLLALNIQCKEVLLYTEKTDDLSAVFVVKAESSTSPTLEKVASETLRCQMQITRIGIAEDGYVPVFLRKKSKFDCAFGLSSCNKTGNDMCGDCHSIIRLGGNKFLLALCDGMGAGEKAHNMSAMTLGLIENFYKAGFDNEIILSSVNKLLSVNNGENYSTLDVCLLDLDLQKADFIKVGAPFGLIKRDGQTEVVQGGALPIGALDKISPFTKSCSVSTKDIVVMVTDGISDAFETEENMIEFVSKLASNNPQTLAETILNEAIFRSNMSAKDDMTVLVARMYLKNK